MTSIRSTRSLYMTIAFLAIAKYVVSEELQYCPFYDNRGTAPQPFLKNCTWYKDNACCTQIEIDNTFASVKPPQGASEECLRQLNFLLCYICDPLQYKFYRDGYLTVELKFCDNLYDACKTAILKGSVISDLYRNGQEFCESRSFIVKMPNDTKSYGFFYSDTIDSNAGYSIRPTVTVSNSGLINFLTFALGIKLLQSIY